MSLITIVALAGMAGAIVAVSGASQRENRAALERARALAAAEAAVADAFTQLAADSRTIPSIGSASAPRWFADDAYHGSVVVNPDGSYTVVGVGRSGIARRAVEVVIEPATSGIFQNAIFSGNASDDPNYVMEFSGRGSQGDQVVGDVYSGGRISITEDSRLQGVPRATGSISAAPGTLVASVAGGATPNPQSGVRQPIPDIAGMHYEANNDVDVAAEFASAPYASGTPGGKAWQLPQTSPAHIFRKNPSDRTSNTSSTVKDDYFLEDPYERMATDSRSDGTDPYMITFSSPTKTVGAREGNNKVYFIDGNLWIHNLSSFSFRFQSNTSAGVQATFVVKGNIYISDNVYLEDPVRDGVAFIAIKDAAVPESGNVYFGDPTFGTLEHMNAFMYAENNFYDNNLDATGSARVDLIGNMTAGEKVAINRDYGSAHSRLSVRFDSRIADGTLVLPGLPRASGADNKPSIRVWREVGVPTE